MRGTLMFKKTLAIAAIAIAGVFAVPMVASAQTDPYVDPDFITVVGTPVAGESVDIVHSAGSFLPGESVTATVEGEPTPTIAVLKTGVASATKAANADGSITFTVNFHPDAEGRHTITATGLSSGRVAVSAVDVVPAGDGSGAGGSGGGSGLPNTGAETPVLAIWIGGGALALGAALIATLTVVRRQRAEAGN
jgi:LPXTG-motif cell wall-anchored protein